MSVPLPAEVQGTFLQNHRKHKCDLIINMFQVNVENRAEYSGGQTLLELIKAIEEELSHVWSEAAAC